MSRAVPGMNVPWLRIELRLTVGGLFQGCFATHPGVIYRSRFLANAYQCPSFLQLPSAYWKWLILAPTLLRPGRPRQDPGPAAQRPGQRPLRSIGRVDRDSRRTRAPTELHPEIAGLPRFFKAVSMKSISYSLVIHGVILVAPLLIHDPTAGRPTRSGRQSAGETAQERPHPRSAAGYRST